MTHQEIHQIATIVDRYAQVNNAAEQAKQAITNLRFVMLENICTAEEAEVLAQALRIVERAADNTRYTAAVAYIKSL